MIFDAATRTGDRTGPHRRALRSVAAVALVVGGFLGSACSGEADTPAAPEAPAAPEVSLSPAAQTGRDVARELGCQACHSVDGSESVGPTWSGLYGAEVRLSDGSTTVADDAYLTRAIEEPSAEIRDGFSDIMPERRIDPPQLAAILDYLREIGET